MPKQPDDLFGGAQFSWMPDTSRSEPRLWVRRLAIWEEPGAAPIRDISFRPGLNIIWSRGVRETSNGGSGVIGHGSGKTLLCRLIRYCMGERRFAPEDQRTIVGAKLMEGHVGAEIMLDGTCWAILRPLGHRQRHVAMADGNLDTIAAGDGAHTGIEPFITAVEDAFFTRESIALIPGEQAWLTELAWLTRDQESGFSRLLEWRDPSSGSESPVSALSNEDRLYALRVFLKSITAEERALADEIREMEMERDRLKKTATRTGWSAEQTKLRLAAELGLREQDIEGPLAVEALKQTARAKFSEIAGVTPDSGHVDPAPIREELKEAQAEQNALREKIAALKARVEEKNKSLERMKKEVVGIALSTDEEENPACPLCEVPIDRVLAEGCEIAKPKLVDLESIKRKRENHRLALESEQDDLNRLSIELPKLESDHQQAAQRTNKTEEQLNAVQAARDAHSDKWYATRRQVDDALRYEQLVHAHSDAESSFSGINEKIKGKREQRKLLQEKQQQVFTRISGVFNAIIKRIVGDMASGTVRLTGDGLFPSIQMGGNRSSQGIKGIEIFAFDLTALYLSVETGSYIAPLLIHDSPRGADLDIEVYHRYFRFVREFQDIFGQQPPFQYIMTTTTKPPDELTDVPWIRKPILSGAPASERLLKRDL